MVLLNLTVMPLVEVRELGRSHTQLFSGYMKQWATKKLSYFRFLGVGIRITYIVHQTCTHTELMDMLLVVVKVLDCLLASQT